MRVRSIKSRQVRDAQVILKYNPTYKPDPNASTSLQPEQAGAAGVGRPARKVSLRYNLKVVDAMPTKVPNLDPMAEPSTDSIAAYRSTQEIAA